MSPPRSTIVRPCGGGGREALHDARERVDPIEQRVFGAFSPKDQIAFREFLLRFIEAFEGE